MSALHGLGLRRLAGNAAVTLGRQVAAGLLQLVTVVIIARALGPEGNGQYAVALLLPTMLATFLNFGIGPANVYFLGASKVDTLTVFRAISQLSLVIVTAGLVAGALCITFFGTQWFPNVPEALLWVALAVFPFALFQSFLSSIFQGLQKFRVYNLILLTQPTVTLLLVLIMVLLGIKQIEYILAGHLIGFLATIGVCLVNIRTEIVIQASTLQQEYVKKAVNYGYKAHLGNILAFVNYKADLFLINFLISPVTAGIYVIAVQLVERLWLLSQAASTVALPYLSELSNNEQRRRQVTPVLCRTVIAITLFAAVVLGCIARPLVSLAFGDEYLEVVVPLLVLLPGVVAWSGARILANDIAARNRPELNMYLALFVAIINVSGNMLLIPLYGLVGAAVATTVAYVSNLFLTLAIYKKITKNTFATVILLTGEDIIRITNTMRVRRSPQI